MALDSVFSKARFCPLLLHQLLLGRKCLNRTYHGAFVEVPPKSKGHAHPKIAATPKFASPHGTPFKADSNGEQRNGQFVGFRGSENT